MKSRPPYIAPAFEAEYKTQGLFVLIVCLIYIIQDIFTRESFAEASSHFAHSVQSWSINEPFFFTVSIIVSDGSFIVTGLMVAYILWRGHHRVHMINYLVILTTVTSLMSLLKLFYNDPRPYMVYPIVQAKECSAEYGNPSGHAMLNSFAALYGMSVIGGQHMVTFNKKKF